MASTDCNQNTSTPISINDEIAIPISNIQTDHSYSSLHQEQEHTIAIQNNTLSPTINPTTATNNDPFDTTDGK